MKNLLGNIGSIIKDEASLKKVSAGIVVGQITLTILGCVVTVLTKNCELAKVIEKT